jgi:acyl-lipid omega-6 desaturase (Delta-12 desaturase)
MSSLPLSSLTEFRQIAGAQKPAGLEGCGPAGAPDPRALAQSLSRYQQPSYLRGMLELAITAVPLSATLFLMSAALDLGYWWICLLLAIPAAGFVVRLFMIQHDCGHGAFFRHRFANDWIGRIIGIVTLTPYDFWRRTHAIHHASSGNLDGRGIGDIDMITVREYLALSRGRRLLYRLYRHPLVMFGVGPIYLFILRHRLPMGMLRNGWQPWASTMATNAAIAIVVAATIWQIGFVPFLLLTVPIALLATSMGVWLFYVQHQFADTYWAHKNDWSFHDAALYGSSYYDLPGVLRWFTANIGVHHVHHLCSRIPYYRLPRVLRDHPQLRAVGRLTLLQSLGCVARVLWDENRRRLVTFREMRSACAGGER